MRLTYNGAETTDAHKQSFLQTWLYFGLLREFVGDELFAEKAADLVEVGSDGKPYLTTRHLEDIVKAWSAKIVSEPWASVSTKFLPWRDHLNHCLLKVRDTALRIKALDPDLLDPLIMMSIAALAEYLMQALNDICIRKNFETPVEQTWRVHGTVDFGQPIRDLMLKQNWCPHDVERFDVEIRFVGVLWFYANLDPPRSTKDHSRCSPNDCVAMQTSKDNYALTHWTADCSCDLVSPGDTAICEILSSGFLPLIDIDSAGDSAEDSVSPKVRIVSENERTEFVAISHVWSDGFGNPRANALHGCVFTHLDST